MGNNIFEVKIILRYIMVGIGISFLLFLGTISFAEIDWWLFLIIIFLPLIRAGDSIYKKEYLQQLNK